MAALIAPKPRKTWPRPRFTSIQNSRSVICPIPGVVGSIPIEVGRPPSIGVGQVALAALPLVSEHGRADLLAEPLRRVDRQLGRVGRAADEDTPGLHLHNLSLVHFVAPRITRRHDRCVSTLSTRSRLAGSISTVMACNAPAPADSIAPRRARTASAAARASDSVRSGWSLTFASTSATGTAST